MSRRLPGGVDDTSLRTGQHPGQPLQVQAMLAGLTAAAQPLSPWCRRTHQLWGSVACRWQAVPGMEAPERRISSLSVSINHTILFAEDKAVSAAFLARVLNRPDPVVSTSATPAATDWRC